MRKIALNLGTNEMYLSGDSDYDANAFVDQPPQYTAALPYSIMTQHELEFIFESRQRDLSETRDPQKRRELLGIISEVSSEMQKRIPQDMVNQLASRGVAAGDSAEVKQEEKKK